MKAIVNLTMKGMIHGCKSNNRKMFFDTELFPNCPFCGEDLTKYQTNEYEVHGVKK